MERETSAARAQRAMSTCYGIEASGYPRSSGGRRKKGKIRAEVEIYEKRIPKEEDFDDYEEYEEKLENWANNTEEDIPMSEGVYEDIMDYYEYEHITSKVFIIEGKQYRVDVVYFHDGEPPDDLNTRVFLVAHEGS